MSRIIGGGGGLTEDEVNTLIGRGEANGTAALDGSSNLLIPGAGIRVRSDIGPGSISIYSSIEEPVSIQRKADNDYILAVRQNNTLSTVITEADRNAATTNGVAGIYNPCKTILNEHRPVCTKEYHLTGKYLDGADNPDVWFPIKGAGVGASVSYANRVLTLKSGTGATSASRCVIDQTKFPITSNFLEVTCEIASMVTGEGGNRFIAIGFQDRFSELNHSSYGNRFIVYQTGSGDWSIGYESVYTRLDETPLARNLQPGDIVTIRLDRQEGSPNIDIGRVYVNGQKQFETTTIPSVDVYAGIGVFNNSNLVDESPEIGIKYFGVRYVP